MEIEATSDRTVVQRWVPNREPVAQAVIPIAQMRKTQAIVHRQTPCHLPVVRDKAFHGVVALVVNIAIVRFLILTGEPAEQVCIRVAAASASPAGFDE